MIYYVDCHAAPGGDGSQEHPFDRIQLAAERAAAGDEVKVLPGIYREEVSPVNAGTADHYDRRFLIEIIYDLPDRVRNS